MGYSHGVLPLASGKDWSWVHAANRRPMGMGMSGRHDHAVLVGDAGSDFSRYVSVSDATHQAIGLFAWSGRPEVIPP